MSSLPEDNKTKSAILSNTTCSAKHREWHVLSDFCTGLEEVLKTWERLQATMSTTVLTGWIKFLLIIWIYTLLSDLAEP